MNNLPQGYKEALRALKDQANAAGEQLMAVDRHVKRAELVDAQKRMAQYPRETKVIYRLLMASNDKTLTIETLDEIRLAQQLGFA